jgi:uncharacterized protein (TIGR04255 family)
VKSLTFCETKKDADHLETDLIPSDILNTLLNSVQKLNNPPIIEAMLDVDCDMPPGQKLAELETAARNAFRGKYPGFRSVNMQEHKIETKPESAPEISVNKNLHAFQFLQSDQKQTVQIRAQGFTFNRLSPYTTLDDYLPQIEEAWNLFVKVAAPIQVRIIRLRYINRILLPAFEGHIKELEDFLKICPRLPDEDKLHFIGFINQHVAVEADTGNQVRIVLAAQPVENNMLPILFDITAGVSTALEPENWSKIVSKIQSLRRLKNMVFENTLTARCLTLFQ